MSSAVCPLPRILLGGPEMQTVVSPCQVHRRGPGFPVWPCYAVVLRAAGEASWGGKGIYSLRPLGAETIVPSWGFQVAYNWVSAATDLLRYRRGSLKLLWGAEGGSGSITLFPFATALPASSGQAWRPSDGPQAAFSWAPGEWSSWRRLSVASALSWLESPRFPLRHWSQGSWLPVFIDVLNPWVQVPEMHSGLYHLTPGLDTEEGKEWAGKHEAEWCLPQRARSCGEGSLVHVLRGVLPILSLVPPYPQAHPGVATRSCHSRS